MGTLLTVGIGAYFFFIAYRVKYAFFTFIFLIPFLPKYIGFGVGGEGFALSLKRILLMILFMVFTLSFIQNSKYISKRISLVYQHNKMLINFLLLLFAIKLVSLSLNSREISLYIMLFDDFLFSIFIFMLTILFIDSEEEIHRLVKIIFYGYIIVLILVLIESFLHYPLLSMFASGGMSIQRDVTEGIVRGGSHRATGSFANPIALGNYLVIMLPVIIAYTYKNKHKLIFKIVYFMLAIYAIYSTGSRSAILMSMALVYLYLTFSLYRGTQFTRLIVNIFNFIVAIIIFYVAFIYVSDLIMNFSGRFDKIIDLEDRSSTARAIQYMKVYVKMLEAPYFGFGRERNFTDLLEFSIDNYYFWMIMEVGLIGLSIYFLFLFTLVKTALYQYNKSYKSYYLFPLLISIFIMIFYQVFSALQENHIYLYMFAGLISIMKVILNDKITNSKDDK